MEEFEYKITIILDFVPPLLNKSLFSVTPQKLPSVNSHFFQIQADNTLCLWVTIVGQVSLFISNPIIPYYYLQTHMPCFNNAAGMASMFPSCLC